MKVAAVIAAGGTGTRMNASVPKQFLEIAGKPIFIHTIERIASLEEVIQIILALPEAHIPAATAILSGLQVRLPIRMRRRGEQSAGIRAPGRAPCRIRMQML